MNYVPSSVEVEEWKISRRRVAILCKEGRIKSAGLVGNRWFIPNDVKKPKIRVEYKKSDRKNSKMESKNKFTIENYLVNSNDLEKRRGIKWAYLKSFRMHRPRRSKQLMRILR